MTDIFLQFVNMSISASWLVLAVVILRLILKKMPKWTNLVLWGIVGLRLIMPFSIESALSLIPSSETISPEIMYTQEPTIHIGIPALNSVINPIITETFAPEVNASANPLQIWITIAAGIWIVGIAAMLLYTLISYLRLNSSMKTAVLFRDNIYQSENIASPFVLGILRPRIYLPFNITDNAMTHVIAHEKTHIKYKDHWIKLIGFLLLSLYWFNPVLWVAYILLCRDIELACDERVVKELNEEQRAGYSEALLSCSVSRKMIAACPIAFSEVGIKERVKSVLNYKKPAFWIIVASIAVCIVVGVCFLTDPAETISWPTLEETRENYSAEQAAADGCVVLDGHTLLAGEKSWIDFVNETESGNPAIVRIYQAYSDQGDMYFVKELRYDGEKYLLQFYDRTGDTNEEFLSKKEYKYLVRSPYSWNDWVTDNYLLANSKEVSAELYYSSIVSPTVRPGYDIYNHSYNIYSNTVDSDYYRNSVWDTTFADIDNDGQEEKCCLGDGRTSGLFTFTLSVYENDNVKYQSVFCTDFYYLSFTKDANGTLQVKGVTQGEPPETHLFDIVLSDGEIKLTENGEALEAF